jgi:copper chaperone CopZ
VRSALLNVPGVTRAQVNLEAGEVLVTYDPRTATVDAIIKAVGQAEGPLMPKQYTAKVKNGPTAASAP